MAYRPAAPAAHDMARDCSPWQRDASWVSRLVSSPGRRPIHRDHDSDPPNCGAPLTATRSSHPARSHRRDPAGSMLRPRGRARSDSAPPRVGPIEGNNQNAVRASHTARSHRRDPCRLQRCAHVGALEPIRRPTWGTRRSGNNQRGRPQGVRPTRSGGSGERSHDSAESFSAPMGTTAPGSRCWASTAVAALTTLARRFRGIARTGLWQCPGLLFPDEAAGGARSPTGSPRRSRSPGSSPST